MMLYTRKQILLVLLLVGASGAGLVIDHWRRARPEIVERLETVDRAAPVSNGRRADAPRTTRRPPARAPRDPESASGRHRAREATPASGGEESRAPSSTSVDINRASVPELVRLPGVGPALAARIVEARPFTALDDLARVRGLRRATLERMRPFLSVLP